MTPEEIIAWALSKEWVLYNKNNLVKYHDGRDFKISLGHHVTLYVKPSGGLWPSLPSSKASYQDMRIDSQGRLIGLTAKI